jgi:uncharacterized protein YbbK (DUF523 family)
MRRLTNVECDGGGDAAEDLKGGLEQLLRLKWENRFRICIIITDSPSHGQKYYEDSFKSSDSYPNENMDA